MEGEIGKESDDARSRMDGERVSGDGRELSWS